MFRRRHLVRLTACVTLVAGACTGDASREASTVRDSAGIRIVDNERPAWDANRGWELDSSPEIDVGPADLLSRVGSMYRLEDGRIIVAHTSVPEIVLYSREGSLLRRFGKRGRGPGEFTDISRMLRAPHGDSILVHDLNQNRITVFDSEGNFIRTAIAVAEGPRYFIDDIFKDGSLLLSSTVPPDLEARGMVRPQRTLFRRAPDGTDTELARIPSTPTFYQELPDGRVDFRSPFFAHSSHYVIWRNRLAWAATDTFQIHVHELDGRLTTIIRKPQPSRPITEADVQPLIEQRASSLPDESLRAAVRRSLAEMPRGTFPAFGAAEGLGPSFQVDDDGYLWVAAYALPGASHNDRLVFDPAGAWLGTVALPPRFAPRHIGRDFILGRWRDSLDVEHVRLYRLRRAR
jgi:hypothetical protein